jgi:hypothetical protein
MAALRERETALNSQETALLHRFNRQELAAP